MSKETALVLGVVLLFIAVRSYRVYRAMGRQANEEGNPLKARRIRENQCIPAFVGSFGFFFGCVLASYFLDAIGIQIPW